MHGSTGWGSSAQVCALAAGLDVAGEGQGSCRLPGGISLCFTCHPGLLLCFSAPSCTRKPPVQPDVLPGANLVPRCSVLRVLGQCREGRLRSSCNQIGQRGPGWPIPDHPKRCLNPSPTGTFHTWLLHDLNESPNLLGNGMRWISAVNHRCRPSCGLLHRPHHLGSLAAPGNTSPAGGLGGVKGNEAERKTRLLARGSAAA